MCCIPPFPVATEKDLTVVPRNTHLLLAANATVWVGFSTLLMLVQWGAMSTATFREVLSLVAFSEGDRFPWTYLTSSFTHIDPVHLAGNLLFLWLIGCYVEEKAGAFRFWLIVLYGSVAGTLAQSLSFSWYGDSSGGQALCFGASDVLMAILGAHLFLNPTVETRFFMLVGLIPVRWSMPAIFYAPVYVLFDLVQINLYGNETSVGHAAHVGGFTAGALLGAYYRLNPKSSRAVLRELESERLAREEQTRVDYKNFQSALATHHTEPAHSMYRRHERGLDPLPITEAEKLELATQLGSGRESVAAGNICRELVRDGVSDDVRLEAGLLLTDILITYDRDLEGAKRLLRVLHRRYKEHPRSGEVNAAIERVKQFERDLFKRPR